jgi:exonuclease SbcD
MSLRILHTADWHLGHVLREFDRTFEHESLIAWLLDAIVRERVDAVLVCGDVFDAANPPTAAQNLWFRFLVEAWRRVPHLQVVVIGGNHDSAARLDATDPFLRAMERLHVVGGVTRVGGAPDIARLVVPLSDRDGAVRAWVAAVPFLRASETGAGSDEDVTAATRRFYDEVLAAARARREPGQALVAMGHLYVAGAQVSALSERRLVVGNQTAVSHDLFPDDLGYVALGHLHLAQRVGARENVRYSGSLLPLDLSESSYEHQVVLVDVEGSKTTATPLRLPRFVEILHVPASGKGGSVDEVLQELARLPDRGEGPEVQRPLLQVTVRLEKPDPMLRQAVEDALAGKEARFARLTVENTGSGLALGDVEVRPIGDLDPEEVFRAKHDKDFGTAPSDDLLVAFHELLDQVHQEER